MNIPISLITLYCLARYLGRKNNLSRRRQILIIAGALLPLLDFLVLMIRGVEAYHYGELYFSSFFYQGFGWLVIAFFYWSYTKQIKNSLEFILPLAGLSWYFLFALLSTEAPPFFAPLSLSRFHLDWVKSGYLIPFILVVLVLFSYNWVKMSRKNLRILALGVVAFYVVVSGLMRLTVFSSISEELKQSKKLSIQPTSHVPIFWDVTAYENGRYRTVEYRLFLGASEEKNVQGVNDLELLQSVLIDPEINRYYYSFQNPLVKAEILNEQLSVEISELIPLQEIYWVNKLSFIKNQQSRLVEKKIHLSLLNWEIN